MFSLEKICCTVHLGLFDWDWKKLSLHTPYKNILLNNMCTSAVSSKVCRPSWRVESTWSHVAPPWSHVAPPVHYKSGATWPHGGNTWLHGGSMVAPWWLRGGSMVATHRATLSTWPANLTTENRRTHSKQNNLVRSMEQTSKKGVVGC